tara:strand:+ start:60 stop:1268 length:1209 start_codon:yes stop_codon:yes gene_type:complete
MKKSLLKDIVFGSLKSKTLKEQMSTGPCCEYGVDPNCTIQNACWNGASCPCNEGSAGMNGAQIYAFVLANSNQCPGPNGTFTSVHAFINYRWINSTGTGIAPYIPQVDSVIGATGCGNSRRIFSLAPCNQNAFMANSSNNACAGSTGYNGLKDTQQPCGPEGCTDPTMFNYDPLACYDDGSCTPGCLSGANPSFNFTNTCDANASYLTWPSYYTAPMPSPQIQPSSTFTWFGNTIFDPLTGTNINSGDSVMSNSINMLLANQGSYCEWCDDIASSGGVSSNMTDYFPIWHDAVPPGGPWSPTVGLTPPDAHCCCCPGQGGGPMNPGAQLSAQMGGGTNGPIAPTQEKICCDWCATVDPNKPSKPPKGCFDFNCKDCRGFKPKPTVIPEHLKRALQIKAGIIK